MSKFAFVCALLLSAAVTWAQPVKKPNIVFILADDLGYGDLSGYGAKDVKSPHLDALAAAGMKFTQFYSNSPVCSPTRAALMTGRYPDLVGVPGVIRTHVDNSWGALSPQSKLLPTLLKQGGYHTAIVGKWHLGLASPDTPTERGFDFFHGFLGDMMDDYYHHRRHEQNYMRRNLQTIDPKGHATELFTQWAIDYLAERSRKPQPFFLYLAYNAPHDPIQPPSEWLEKVKQREPGITEQRAKLVALIEQMDDGIGRVLTALKANGQEQNTLVIFTSDNGGFLRAGANCGDLRGGKEDLYEGGIRVPMLARWPARIPAGTRSERVAMAMDALPTICEAAKIPVKHKIDGTSILPTLLGQNQPPDARDLFWMRREGGAKYQGQDYYAVRRGDWKLVHNSPFEPLQLFNLAADPLEQRNLAQQETKVFQDLAAALRAQLQRAGNVPWQKTAPPAK
jgi:arylsulfatase A-like enzyme